MSAIDPVPQSSDPAAFDPYAKWLGLRTVERPPNHYRLLGIELFESEPDVIATAADRQMAHVRRYQNGPHSEASQRLLNELAAARVCLLRPAEKAEYDQALRRRMPPVASHDRSATSGLVASQSKGPDREGRRDPGPRGESPSTDERTQAATSRKRVVRMMGALVTGCVLLVAGAGLWWWFESRRAEGELAAEIAKAEAEYGPKWPIDQPELPVESGPSKAPDRVPPSPPVSPPNSEPGTPEVARPTSEADPEADPTAATGGDNPGEAMPEVRTAEISIRPPVVPPLPEVEPTQPEPEATSAAPKGPARPRAARTPHEKRLAQERYRNTGQRFSAEAGEEVGPPTTLLQAETSGAESSETTDLMQAVSLLAEAAPGAAPTTGTFAQLRKAMRDRNLPLAWRLWEQLATEAQSFSQRDAADRLRMLLFQLERFWQAVDAGEGRIQPGTVMGLGDKSLTVVRIERDKIVVQTAEGEESFATDRVSIPARLAVGLAVLDLSRRGAAVEPPLAAFLLTQEEQDGNLIAELLRNMRERGTYFPLDGR